MWLVSGQPDRWWSAHIHAKAISRLPLVSDSRRGAMSDVIHGRAVRELSSPQAQPAERCGFTLGYDAKFGRQRGPDRSS